MRNPAEIEDIEEMRLREGIDDVELREAIRRLRVGDFVRVTFLTGTTSLGHETLSVRITSIRGCAFRGKLARRSASPGRSKLLDGTPIVFTTAHIHSLPRREPAHSHLHGVGRRDAVQVVAPLAQQLQVADRVPERGRH